MKQCGQISSASTSSNSSVSCCERLTSPQQAHLRLRITLGPHLCQSFGVIECHVGVDWLRWHPELVVHQRAPYAKSGLDVLSSNEAARQCFESPLESALR